MDNTTAVWLVESCGHRHLALVGTAVYRCLEQPKIIQVPTARSQFVGVIDWQGDLVPVVIGPERQEQARCVLLLHSRDPHNPLIGLALADYPKKEHVGDDATCPPEAPSVELVTEQDADIEGAMPEYWWHCAFSGLLHKGQVIPLLHPERLLE